MQAEAPVVVVVNKVDIADKEQVLVQLGEAGEWDFEAYVPISAKKSDGMDLVIRELVALCEPGPFFFPSDAKSDQPDQLLAAELIREKYLARLRDELPHSLAVVINELETLDNGVVRIDATAYVERESQKGMVIGKGGKVVRDVGTEARVDLERLFGTKVFLELNVKVEKDWQSKNELLDRMGF
jgi:GTP-binding protein Era